MINSAILLAIIMMMATTQSSGHCIWYGECYSYYNDSLFKEFIFNCPYTGPGKPVLDAEASRILLKRCPDIYKTGED